MLRHNLLIIYRSFRRFRSVFLINLAGLSAGLSCVLLIWLWVSDELNMDKFHTKDQQLFQVMEHQQHSGNIRVTDSTPWLLAETLKEEMPEVEYAVTATPTYWFSGFTLSVHDKVTEARGQYVGQDYFNVFSYPLIHGNASQVLADKKSIVISEDVAMKLFSTTDNVVGKVVELQHEETYIISGVFKNVPASSSVQFDFALSYKVLTDKQPQITNWGNSGPMTYVVLKEGTDLSQFSKKIAGVIGTKTDARHRSLFVRKYSDAYLYDRYENGVQAGGRIAYVTQFSIIALFILVIACINFMNLSTAKASRRIKEVGIKKAVGASRKTLIAQYLGESILMAFLSLALAILFVDLFLPQFNSITGKRLALHFDSTFMLTVSGIVLFTGLLSGSYPALYLSGFNPATVLKGKLNTSLGELWARKGLVVFQFAISMILIASVWIVYQQIRFVQNKNLGYDKENMVYFEMKGRIKQNPETFLTEVKKLPGVVNASTIAQSMVGGGNTTNIDWEGKDPERIIPFAIRPVNYDVLEMLDVKLKEGRYFSRAFGADSTSIIFNEAAIRAMGLSDPLGKVVTLGPYKFNIVGVVRDFHFESLHTNVSPMFFVMRPEFTDKAIIRIEKGRTSETLASLQKFCLQYNPGFPFDFRFLDQDYQAQYQAEQRVATLSGYFAGLAVLISCLGLFGLAAFSAERRLKEIGIRKVLGASEMGIVYLLSSDFTRIVFIAIVIALPVSYFIASSWLAGFAYKITLAWWYFAGTGVVALLIAWLTVGMQAIKAAGVNPVSCLRDE